MAHQVGAALSNDESGDAEPAVGGGFGSRASRLLRAGARAIADVIVPPVCLACKAPLCEHHALCATCWGQVDFIRAPLCDRLGIPLTFDTGGVMISAGASSDPPDYDRARAVAAYHGVMRGLIHGFKYSDRHNARRLFGRWLVTAGETLIAECDVAVPIPLNRWRLLHRRFNQSAILAMEVARRTGIAHAPLALVRTKKTSRQVGLTLEERRQNVAGAFAVPERWLPAIAGRRVLLIDDVITTGATANAAARALKSAGAARVDILALALVGHGTIHGSS
ncbi:MAG: ComF family protein [Hyphomicrobiaceae bacterium]